MSSAKTIRQVLCVVGARPNFMKIAPIMRALNEPRYGLCGVLIHTGQHYDCSMNQSFFDQLKITKPEINLEVGSGTHAVQTAEIMRRFEPVLEDLKPDAVLVVGDVNSTIACALVSTKKNIPVIHVEAGLRSKDRSMPEEINRVLTDQISDLLFTTERTAEENLIREGVDRKCIEFVGNVMIDTLLDNIKRAVSPKITIARYCDEKLARNYSERYGLVTLHRPSNVDDPKVLKRLLTVLSEISTQVPLIFPIHPRTKRRIEEEGFDYLLDDTQVLKMPPLGYLELLGLMRGAMLVLTDSGGIQEETTALGVPCITLRENTERPITVSEGTNTVVGSDPEKILNCFESIIVSGGRSGCVPDKWDGKAAERIAQKISHWLS